MAIFCRGRKASRSNLRLKELPDFWRLGGRGFFDRRESWQQPYQAGNLHHGDALLSKSRQHKLLRFAFSVDEQLDQSPNAGRIQEGHSAHVQYQLISCDGPQRLQKAAYALQVQFSGKLGDYGSVARRDLRDVQFRGLHTESAYRGRDV